MKISRFDSNFRTNGLMDGQTAGQTIHLEPHRCHDLAESDLGEWSKDEVLSRRIPSVHVLVI